MIKNFISIGGPFLGLPENHKIMLTGPDWFNLLDVLKIHYPGLTQFNVNLLIQSTQRAVDPDLLFNGEKWYDNVKLRMQYENGEKEVDESEFRFLPDIKDDCSPTSFKYFNSSCKLQFYNFTNDDYMIKIEEEEFKIGDMDQFH